MTLNEFHLLSEDEQSTIILCEGVFIDVRFERGYRILLYHIECFYAEVFYSSADNEIQMLRSFSSTDLLEPYLSRINLKGLMNR